MHIDGFIENIVLKRTRNFTVRVDAVMDDDFNPYDWEDAESIMKRLDSGKLQCFGVIAQVILWDNGERVTLGRDSLWGCLYESVSDFKNSGYLHDMVHEAVTRARKRLKAAQAVKIRSMRA